MSEDNSPSCKELRRAAMNALSRREYAYQELYKKLSRSFKDAALICQVLDTLREENLQSDQRYTEAFVRYRKQKGQGPVRIAEGLQQAGVSDSLIAEYLDASDEQWQELALSVHAKRFSGKGKGGVLGKTASDIVKQQRFLTYRGFTSAQIRYVLGNSD